MLLQNIIEKSGIPTVSISLLMEITRKVDPPRVLELDLPLGYPLGEPDNPALQMRILMAAFNLVTRDSPQAQSFSL